MRTRGYYLLALGAVFLLAAAPAVSTMAGEAEQKGTAPAPLEKSTAAPQEPKESAEMPAAPEKPKPAEAKRPAGRVGTVVAVVPASRTVVVDIPVGNDVLRLGATVTEKTKIRAAGAPAPLESLKEGDRVRVQFRRVADGDEATMVEVLRGSKG